MTKKCQSLCSVTSLFGPLPQITKAAAPTGSRPLLPAQFFDDRFVRQLNKTLFGKAPGFLRHPHRRHCPPT
jgi:hypothetical protein